MVEEFLLIDQYHTEPSWGDTESKLNRLKVLGVSCVTLFTSKYGPQKESPLKHCHATNPTSLSTFSLDFSHHKIQDGTALHDIDLHVLV